MTDLEPIYAAFQFAMVLMLAALALMLAMRARAASLGVHTETSVVVLWLLAGFMAVWAARLGWWHIRWVLRALDMHGASDAMTDRVVVPLVANILGLIIGGAMLSIAGRDAMGRASAPIVIGSVIASIITGAIISGAIR